MTDEEKFGFWLGHAQYDLDAAEAMFKSGRWVYVVFMCQQAIEKLVKGLYLLYIDDNVPRLHNINAIFSRFSDRLPQQIKAEYLDLFRQLSDCYKNTRYTEYIRNVSEMINESVAKSILDKTKEAYQWLLTQKP
jgi:HEPN domain-containing protein